MKVFKRKEEAKSSSPLFSRGYNKLDEKLDKNAKWTMSCYNCKFFYQTDEDEEEVCQNLEVTQYDMVVSETNIVCNRWRKP